MRSFALIIATLAVAGSLFSQESFRQYYGQPYPFANEEGFSIEKIGDRFALIGTRESKVARGDEDIAFWYFDPVTLELTDSMVIALPEAQRLLDTYAGPDGGVLVIYEREQFSNGNDYVFAYFGPDGALAWENEIVDEVPEINFSGIRDVTFRSPTELVLSFSTFGSGEELGARLVTFTSTDGIANSFTYGQPGTIQLWSVEHQPNGDLLIAGEALNEVFVALLAADGTVKWESTFEDVEESFGAERYDFLSNAHRPANDTVILVTGAINSFTRAFIVMDTLGNRLEEYTLEDFSFSVEGKEQATWIGDSLLFINDNDNEFFALFSLDRYEPNGNYNLGEGNASGYSLNGSYYLAGEQQIFSASTQFGDDDDAAIIRFNAETLEVGIRDVGTSGTSSNEEAFGLELGPEEGFLLITQGIDPLADGRANFFYVDDLGRPLDTLVIRDNFFQAGPLGVGNIGTEDVLLLFNPFNRWSVHRYTTAGTLRWSAEVSDVNSVSRPLVIGLPDGRFAGREVRQTQQQIPPFSITQTTSMFVADSTGTISDTVSTNRLNFSTVILGSQNDLVFAGNAYTRDTAIILSQDIASNGNNWEYTTSFGEGVQSNAGRIARLTDGSYAVIVATSRQFAGVTSSGLIYLHLSAAGEELLRKELATELSSFQSPVLQEVAPGQVTIAYGAGRAPVDPAGAEIFELIVYQLDAATGEELLTTAFQSPFSRTSPIDLKQLEDGRTAILANATGSDTSASPDVLFLVFDEDGRITSLESAQPLGIDITLSPNPTPNVVTLAFQQELAGRVEMLLLDVSGKQLDQRQLSAHAGSTTTVDLTTFPAGNYFLVLRSQEGRLEVRKLIKQ